MNRVVRILLTNEWILETHEGNVSRSNDGFTVCGVFHPWNEVVAIRMYEGFWDDSQKEYVLGEELWTEWIETTRS